MWKSCGTGTDFGTGEHQEAVLDVKDATCYVTKVTQAIHIVVFVI